MAKAKSNKITNTSTQYTGGSVASKALYCDDRMPNTARVSNTSQGVKATGNQKLYHTSITAKENADTHCQDDMSRIGAPSDRLYPAEFQSTNDLSNRVNQWRQMQENTNDRLATNRNYSMQAGVRGTVNGTVQLDVPGFHKGPDTYSYSQQDNQDTGNYSTGQIDVKYSNRSPSNYTGMSNHAPTSGTVYYG